MATIVLGAVGGLIGAGFGGSVLGLSGAVIGRAIGATLGRVIDQRLMGAGSETVEVGRIERFRLLGASEGAAVVQVFGRARVSGQVIWATRFLETRSESESGGGKGTGRGSETTVVSYSYSVSLAVALCEGRILRVGRIWADGVEIDRSTVNLRVYHGDETQLPDPKIAAVEGADAAPAYRGIPYVVFEDLQIGQFGNRVPQFSFEVVRPAQGNAAAAASDYVDAVRAVALMPGTGEYALATTPVHYSLAPGVSRTANMNFPSGMTDFSTSLLHLREELPNCRSVSLVVSWFGDDLRCGACRVRPKVEQKETEAPKMPWRAGGIARSAAQVIAQVEGRPVYGGTPSDQSVIEAIKAIQSGGQEVMFYPFVLMEQLDNNALPDPWSGAARQPSFPWRGRITLSVAPGRDGSPDGTAAATAEVAAFFGSAQVSDFTTSGGQVSYSGPADWGYKRFILHYAKLCALAGGVDAFCIGSELRGVTQIRGAGGSFPAVAALRQLAGEVRAILGPGCKISYAADWSEYFGYHDASGNVQFHLDPLWADPNIDFIGIDNYMPISDWRDGEDHADADWPSIYDLGYLKSNIAGGEGFDWFYDDADGLERQRRVPITDGAHSEPWVFRYKDIVSWWSLPHHDRIDGVRSIASSDWVPRSKPIRFTELGCPAVDKGPNEPNKFIDPKSSESRLPHHSSGRRDDVIQLQYLRAQWEHWQDPANNPVSEIYGERMVDAGRMHVWAWDSRPFPVFPNLTSAWSDGGNYALGHWLNGRATNQPLASVVGDLCERSGIEEADTTGLYGVVRGYALASVDTARAALQPLMLAYGFDAVERGGKLLFKMREARVGGELDKAELAVSGEIDGPVECVRAAEAEMVGRVRLGFVEAEGNFETKTVEAIFPDEESLAVSTTELALTLTRVEGRGIAERWLADARVARDSVRLAVPKSDMRLGAGDVVRLDGLRYRIDRVEQGDYLQFEGVRVEPSSHQPSDASDVRPLVSPVASTGPVLPLFLDLPLLDGAEVPHAPHIAVAAKPWPGPVAVWSSDSDDGYRLNRLVSSSSLIGVSETPLAPARAGLIDRGAALRVRLGEGVLSSLPLSAMLNGRNLAAIGDGSSGTWEVFQFATAELVAPQTFDLQGRLRGQAGSEPMMERTWPVGSYVVFLDERPDQIDLPLAARGLGRHYRIGAARRGYDDLEVVHRLEAFAGIGLRPYRPAFLRAQSVAEGTALSWVRRSRIDGDSWETYEVPVGEDREAYLLRVWHGSVLKREVRLTSPEWLYPTAMRLSDGTASGGVVEVAQLSERFGPGPFAATFI